MAGVLVEQIAAWGEATFHPPANAAELYAAETSLGHTLPNDLAQVLAESNGIDGEYGLGLLWNLDRILRDNIDFRTGAEFREHYRPFEALVFFADAGNGDQFALSLTGDCQVYVWNHENDNRTWIAPTVMAYLEGWLTGRITV